MPEVYLPSDEFGGNTPPNLDLAADYLELRAVLSGGRQAFGRDIVDALELAAEQDYTDVDSEIQGREEVAAGAVARLGLRCSIVDRDYPFEIDPGGGVITFTGEFPTLGQTAYLVSLLLSNLRTLSPLLNDPGLHPSEAEVRDLRQYFQYFACAAIAGEIGGSAWSFGHPRPDHVGFLRKLGEIWAVLKDGTIQRDPAAPVAAKDDQVDVFAWREQKDGLPGFLLVAGQVATGNNWRAKSIKHHIARVFPSRWFGRIPATDMIAYHVIPFARPDDAFRDDVLVLGNVLHRLRVPRRVSEACDLVQHGVMVEAFELLTDARALVVDYTERARTA